MYTGTYEGMLAETRVYSGHESEEVGAYFARPLGSGSYPGVVVVHHMPGWDAATKEITRRFAHNGYLAIDPNLHYREGPGAPDDVAAVVRSQGGVPDGRAVGDISAAADYLRSSPLSNGCVGVIGFCSGGRQAYLAACSVDNLDAVVDCWGSRVIASADQLTERQPVAPIDMTGDLGCPLLGIFGAEDQSPSPDQVQAHQRELASHDKDFEFHTFENAGHGFFAVDRPGYRPVQATEAWDLVFKFFHKHLVASDSGRGE